MEVGGLELVGWRYFRLWTAAAQMPGTLTREKLWRRMQDGRAVGWETWMG